MPALLTILIVDDDITQRLTLRHFLTRVLQAEVEEASGGVMAMARLADKTHPLPDLVLLDYYMPGMDGRETLRVIRKAHPKLPVIMLTSNDELENAVALMREGANDFITKPFEPERLKLSVVQNLTITTLKSEVAKLKRAGDGRGNFAGIIGAEGGLANSIALARKAASSEIPVLISGESGTGKERVARAIHGESVRGTAPFIAVNCGAIPENLVESTLFGHEKGSFTGAISREPGKFREAEGGTLFLDEVGELKPEMQTRLLRALQEREIEPVGASRPVRVDVRIISATHRTLAMDVTKGRFREDLFYRLNVLPILLPPLRARITDIPELARHTLARFCESEGRGAMRVSEPGMRWLERQRWAGNVRELENLLYRAVVLSDRHELGVADFTDMTGGGQEPLTPTEDDSLSLTDDSGRPLSWDAIEARVIAWALARSGGNVHKAARLLDMGQSTLYKKIAVKPEDYTRKFAGSL